MVDFTALYQTLHERQRPEDVAELLLPLLRDQLTHAEYGLLERAASGSLRRQVAHYSSMPSEFSPPVGATRQAHRAAELFEYSLPESMTGKGAFDDPAQVRALLQELNSRLTKATGLHNYRTDRLDRAAREAAGLGSLSRRRYNKLFRSLRHLEEKLERLTYVGQQRELQLISKHGFAHEIALTDFASNVFSASFIAYYTACCNLRSEFTNGAQQRPYDEVAAMLFQRCLTGQPRPTALERWLTSRTPTPSSQVANWWAIAQVYPAPEVLANLSDGQRGELLSRWTTLLARLAEVLRQAWATNTFQRETMIVKRGDNSSTWNTLAGAWNKARDSWLNLVHSMGLEWLLDDFCPGKVLRLMAADVAYWHQQSGGKLDPNTQVWATLPLPWEVLSGAARCGRATVAAACQAAGLNPEKSCWLAPRLHGVAPLRPTPELVHGVSVSNPYLALILRKNKVYSGKQQLG